MPETTLQDSCSKTWISSYKRFKTHFTLILYTVALCQLFIKDMMMMRLPWQPLRHGCCLNYWRWIYTVWGIS